MRVKDRPNKKKRTAIRLAVICLLLTGMFGMFVVYSSARLKRTLFRNMNTMTGSAWQLHTDNIRISPFTG
ncbi:MAG: hypothetical protein AB7V25_11665, partial [Mangrovibacterium sp.]